MSHLTYTPPPAVPRGHDRSRPRLWQHDYLHLRPLAADLRPRILAAAAGPLPRVLDLGCGFAPYRADFPPATAYIGADLEPGVRPQVLAVGEALPFGDGVIHAVLSSQVLPVVEDPSQVAAEMRRVAVPGAPVWVSCHGAWPHSTPRPEHRFGEPDLRALFSWLDRLEVIPQGGMLGMPFALANIGVREAVRAAERRLGAPARLLWIPAHAFFLVSNLAGRLLERLARWGPLRPFLGYLHGSMPMNYLVAGVRR